MNGLLIIDKPRGVTSFDVVRQVRRLCRTRRVGHAGTLDPLATGVLPVAVGEGTRILQFIMEGDKAYRATFKLGETTDSQDAEGQVLERRPVEGVDEAAVRAACLTFVGPIRQVPPMYSALKKDGVPLHRLARQGIEVEREARTVEILRLEVLEVRLPFVTIEVDCSKGTYIRTLCHDIGLLLGPGAHLTELRRIRNAGFSEGDSVPLEMLQQDPQALGERLLSLTEALAGFPSLEVAPAAARRLRDGVPPALDAVLTPVTCAPGTTVLLLDGGALLAVARFEPERAKEKRGDFELLRVFNSSGPE